MITRRNLGFSGIAVTLGALFAKKGPDIEHIGHIDYSGWQENTFAGMDREAFKELLPAPAYGPYGRWYWMDQGASPGDFPVIRAEIFVDDRSLRDPRFMHVSLNAGRGWRQFSVQRLDDGEVMAMIPYDTTPHEHEAVMRVVRVLMRREHGLGTAYTT